MKTNILALILTIAIISVLIINCAMLVKEEEYQMREISIIPKPAKMQIFESDFIIRDDTKILVESGNEEIKRIGEYFVELFNKVSGYNLKVGEYNNKEKLVNAILLTIIDADKSLGDEGYELSVTPNSVILRAPKTAGLFYGVQTIRALLPVQIESPKKVRSEITWSIPHVKILDMPRYKWRGMHLDVCRHFMPKEFVKKYIDYLAMHKFNTFHWHLTEDQGWRIEIKKYPKLTEIGAWRKETLIGYMRDEPPKFDGKPHGGFYTQEEIKEIVEYAKSRYITIVPEIEMPGHAGAALAAYPELSCTGGPFEVMTKWGINEDVYCAGNEKTFSFLEDVLLEVIELFPSEYIHIGGDECPKARWEECPKCQARIKENNLKDEHELQSYFIKRIEWFLNSKGRKLIGWDEILEGGLAPDATVMSWRGIVGGIEASKAGHDVVMAPYSHVYFDYYQGNPDLEPLAIGGYLPLKKVYSFEPTPEDLFPEQSKHILGAQANVWTEYIKTPENVEYMAFPRIAAISEVVWTPKELKNWDDFIMSMDKQFKRYELLGINYAKSVYNVNFSSVVDTLNIELMVNLDAEAYQPTIYYTLDGREPTTKSNLFEEPFALNKTSIIKAVVFKEGKLLGKISRQEFLIHKAIGRKIKYKYPYNERYTGGGDFALVDGIRGTKNIRGGHWQGYEGDDLEVVVDLGEITTISKISVGFLQVRDSWIFLPIFVEYTLSKDRNEIEAIGFIKNDIPMDKGGVILKDFTLELPETKARLVKIKAKNIGVCPQWHRGAGDKAWLFADEIIVE
ncbi:hypothetical protein ES703_56603 [subsurface metagenome]